VREEHQRLRKLLPALNPFPAQLIKCDWKPTTKEIEKLMGKILHVQAGDWPAIEASGKPVFVDFWAEWCAPCWMLAPTFEKLAEKYGDHIDFAKVNVDELPELANQFAVRSIPTLVLLRDNAVVERLVGVRPYEELARLLERHVAVPVRR
jgi:thioredoxin 1